MPAGPSPEAPGGKGRGGQPRARCCTNTSQHRAGGAGPLIPAALGRTGPEPPCPAQLLHRRVEPGRRGSPSTRCRTSPFKPDGECRRPVILLPKPPAVPRGRFNYCSLSRPPGNKSRQEYGASREERCHLPPTPSCHPHPHAHPRPNSSGPGPGAGPGGHRGQATSWGRDWRCTCFALAVPSRVDAMDLLPQSSARARCLPPLLRSWQQCPAGRGAWAATGACTRRCLQQLLIYSGLVNKAVNNSQHTWL